MFRMQKNKADSRNSRPSSASRVGSSSTRQNMPGSAENIKALYDRGRPSSTTTTTTPLTKGKTTIKPKQTTTSMQRQKVNIWLNHLSPV